MCVSFRHRPEELPAIARINDTLALTVNVRPNVPANVPINVPFNVPTNVPVIQ